MKNYEFVELNNQTTSLHISGEEKRKVYEKAISEEPPEKMPVRFVLHQTQVPVTVYWAP